MASDGTLHDTTPGTGFTVLDGLAMVLGAAIASIHVRELVTQGLTAFGWGLIWLTFAGIALSAAGPFVLLARRFGRRPDGYPTAGDWLWALLGLPWVLAAVLRAVGATPAETEPNPGSPGDGAMPFDAVVLWVSLTIACLIALGVIWRKWVLAPPEPDQRPVFHTWTERVGLVLAVSWPLQCGLGLVVFG